MKYFLINILFFSISYSEYLNIQFASFSYTIGGSYGSCVKFKKSEYNFNDFDACSCAWAANTSNYSDCYELYYNPQTKMIKYNLSEGADYIDRNFSSDYTCHIYNEEIQINECSEMNESKCSNDGGCEWIEDIEIINCSTLSTSGWGPGSCEYYYPDCYNYLDYGGWYGSWTTECGGGTAQIDNSYCEEVSFIPGDMNDDGSLNISDIVLMVDLILNLEFYDYSDMNQDGILNIMDIIELVNRILDN